MEYDVPDDRYYTESHEWLEERNGSARIGIADFAQDELGDIVFVDLPAVGETFAKGDAFGVIESIKAVSDIYVPVGGEIVDRHETVVDEPELVNDDPFGEGWLVEIEATDGIEDPDLLSPEEYRNQIE